MIVILFATLTLIFYFNTIKNVKSLDGVYLGIIKHRPATTPFSLGYNKNMKLYRNAVLDKDGKITIKNDESPIGYDGLLIVQKDHGSIINKDNGRYS